MHEIFINNVTFNYRGSGKDTTFREGPWNKYELPTDAEIVAGVFCGYLD
jgi:hypothetical protein